VSAEECTKSLHFIQHMKYVEVLNTTLKDILWFGIDAKTAILRIIWKENWNQTGIKALNYKLRWL